MINYRRVAKEFAATYAVKLTDRQYQIFVDALATVLRDCYDSGRRDGEFRAIEKQEGKDQ